MNRFLLTIFVASFFVCTSSAFANEGGEVSCEAACAADQVKVSFADGDDSVCMCKVRSIEMTDTPETPNNCVDEDDDGSCS